MPNYQYRALTQNGEVVSGSISAASAAEVGRRIEYLGLVPIEAIVEHGATISRMTLAFFSRPSPEDVTVFTRDLALLLRAGARLHDALDLLANDMDIGRLRPAVGKIKAAVLAGESFADAIARNSVLFSPMYVALVRVGEASGTLDHILELLANERTRAGAMRRKLLDALQYPAFVLAAASCVLIFFLLFVLPQFSAVLRDFNAKLDPVVSVFLNLSDKLHAHTAEFGAGTALILIALWLLLRRGSVRAALVGQVSRLPFVRSIFNYYRSALFCRKSWHSPRQRRQPHRHASNSGRHDGDHWERRRLGDYGRSCAPRRKTFGGAGRNFDTAANGDAHVAPGRGDWAAGHAGRPCRRFLRSQAPAQPGSRRRHRGAGCDHCHQCRRRRAPRVGDDGTVIGQSSRRITTGDAAWNKAH